MNIVQIGANRAYDNLTNIVMSYRPDEIKSLIIVEPFDLHNNSISSCYKNYFNSLHIENIVVSPTLLHDKTIKIWYHPSDLNHNNAAELASLNKQHAINIRSHYDANDMKFIECNAININELFDKYNLDNIDILYIDTEGFDDQIIYCIDFHKYTIKKLYYENLHIDKYKLRNFLEKHNYKIQQNIDSDPYADLATLVIS